MGALGGFAEQVLELGEHLLDRVQVGAVRRQNSILAPTLRMAVRTAGRLWLDRLSMITTSPAESVGTRYCST
jgi:hypothetical protein